MAAPLLQGLLPLSWRGALRDGLSGVVLASMNAPQVLGYTRIAGTPAVTGLYTVLAPLVGFALFGSSRHLVVAADSATAAIFSSALTPYAAPGSEKYMALVGMLTLLIAGFLLIARLFKLGFLADFLSRTALTGFLTGVGVQVAVAMLPDMLGVATTSRRTLFQAYELIRGLPGLKLAELALSAAVVVVILLAKKFCPKAPIPMLVILAAIGASAAFGFEQLGIATLGFVPGGLPSLVWPDVSWTETLRLMPVAASCFVMILAQSAATARVYALRHGERVDENADLLGLAAANAGAALTGAFVVNGSPTQTAMADSAGARSQAAQLAFVACVALILLFATGPLRYLPRCVLSAVVFSVALGMIDIKGLKAIAAETRGEFHLAALSAAAVPLIGVEQGILIAIGLSLVHHVRHSYRPIMEVLTPGPGDRLTPTPALAGRETAPGVIAFRFGAGLFYANADHFADMARLLVAAAPHKVTDFVIDASATSEVDFSAARSLRDLFNEWREAGIVVRIGRASDYLRAHLDRHGLTDLIGRDNIFDTLHDALRAAGLSRAA